MSYIARELGAAGWIVQPQRQHPDITYDDGHLVAKGLTKFDAIRLCHFMNGGSGVDDGMVRTILMKAGALE